MKYISRPIRPRKNLEVYTGTWAEEVNALEMEVVSDNTFGVYSDTFFGVYSDNTFRVYSDKVFWV